MDFLNKVKSFFIKESEEELAEVIEEEIISDPEDLSNKSIDELIQLIQGRDFTAEVLIMETGNSKWHLTISE